MSTISLQNAQANLSEIISRLGPGEEILIAESSQPLATLKKSPRSAWPCQAGTAKDKILWIAPDFDAPLDEFREYME